jgi:RNA polymerase sigma-70 factor (ECF subfamily)
VTERDLEFAWLFRGEFSRVVRTVYLVVGDHQRAEDIAQDAFVKLLGSWRKVSLYDKPEAWVRRVAIRMAVRTARRERLRATVESQIERPDPPRPRDVDLMRAVRQLPASQRAAVVLFYFEDRPVSQVADLLGCAEATARVHLHRARTRLSKLLGEEESVDVS